LRGRAVRANVSIDNIARIARGLKVKAWVLRDDGAPSGGLLYQHLERLALSNLGFVALPNDERFDQMNAAIVQFFKSSLAAL
jgi:hypothetical protein